MATSWTPRKANSNPVSDADRKAKLAEGGFGKYYTDNMIVAEWSEKSGWGNINLVPYGPLSLDPATAVLHYGQEIFEGLKAYRHPDGSIQTFRPEANAARFRRSAARLAMAELPEDVFVQSIEELVEVDADWVPGGDDQSLYLRPFMISKNSNRSNCSFKNSTKPIRARLTASSFLNCSIAIAAWISVRR